MQDNRERESKSANVVAILFVSPFVIRLCLFALLLTSDTVLAGEEGNEGDVRADVTGTAGDEDPRLLGRHLWLYCVAWMR